MGIDGADEMLKLSQQRSIRRISTNEYNLNFIIFPAQRCRLLLMALSAIHCPPSDDPMVMWQTIANHTRAGAPIFVMDLMRPQSTKQVEEFVQTYPHDEPSLAPDFEYSLHAAIDPLRRSTLSGGSTSQIERTSDRHLIVFGHR